MTRGTIHLILPDKIIFTDQFNGDMYLDGYGYEVIKRLENVDNEKDFINEMVDFNSKSHKYESFKADYVINWKGNKMKLKCGEEPGDPTFADYTYWRNLSGRHIFFIDENNENLILEHRGIAVFNFCKRYLKVYPN